MKPTMQLRWKCRSGTTTKPPTLQQLWMEESRDVGEWRDVPYQVADSDAVDWREIRGCCNHDCPAEWKDDGEGPCPACGYADTEIRTSFFAERKQQSSHCHGQEKP